MDGDKAMSDKPYLLVKWGTIKGYGNLTDAQVKALQKWADLGVSISAMAHKDTPEQKKLLCDAFDLFEDGQIQNDWCGTVYTVDEAKKYIMEYGQDDK